MGESKKLSEVTKLSLDFTTSEITQEWTQIIKGVIQKRIKKDVNQLSEIMEGYLTFQRQPQSFIDKEYFLCNHYAYLSKQRQDVCPYKFCMMDGNMDRVHFLWFKLKDQSPFFTKTMHAAAQKGRFDIVQLIMDTDPFLIRQGLHLAARHGHLPMVQSIMVQMKN